MGLINPFSFDVLAARRVNKHPPVWNQNSIPEHRKNSNAKHHYRSGYNPKMPGSREQQREKRVTHDPQGIPINWKDEDGKKINHKDFLHDTYSISNYYKHHVAGGDHPEVSIYDIHKVMGRPNHAFLTNMGGGGKKRTSENLRVGFSGQIGVDNNGKPLHADVITEQSTRHGKLHHKVLTAYPSTGRRKKHETPYNRSEALNAVPNQVPKFRSGPKRTSEESK